MTGPRCSLAAFPSKETCFSPIIGDRPFHFGDIKLLGTLVSIGNPHFVNFVDGDVDDFPVEEMGPKVEGALQYFPSRINVEFVQVSSGIFYSLQSFDSHCTGWYVWSRKRSG